MKFTIKTTRTIPEGYVRYAPKLGDYPKEMFACYVYRGSDRSSALFYTGKQSKPTWHYKFKDDDAMKQKINTQIKSLMSWYEKKMERKEARKNEVANIKIGDLFYNSWGYDQTNVQFYQVTERTAKTFTIREIAAISHPDSGFGSMSDYVSPVRDRFLDRSTTSLPVEFTKSSMSMEFGMLWPTDESKKHYRSWYA